MQLHEGSHSLLTLHVFQLTWISGIVNFSIFFVLTVRSMGLSLVVVRMVRLSALIWGKGLLLAELIFQLFLLKIMIRYQFISLIASNTLMFFFFGNWVLSLKLQEVTSLQFDEDQGYLMAVGSSTGKVGFVITWFLVWFPLFHVPSYFPWVSIM